MPQRKMRSTKTKKRSTRNDVLDICRTKTKSGHVKCSKCGQWKHTKCIKISIREAEKKDTNAEIVNKKFAENRQFNGENKTVHCKECDIEIRH